MSEREKLEKLATEVYEKDNNNNNEKKEHEENKKNKEHDENNKMNEDKHISISPIAKQICKENNINYNNIKGSGPNNRIIK